MSCTRPICLHRERVGHLADFCIQPRGKIECRSPEDAQAAAQRASQELQLTNNPSRPQTIFANVVLTDTKFSTTALSNHLVIINGVSYTLVPTFHCQ